MSISRVFNDFKRKFIAGEVPQSFNCTAYLMNSGYEKIYDQIQYMRSINDFYTMDPNALYYDNEGLLRGNALAKGDYVKNTYYKITENTEEDQEATTLIIVDESNLDQYKYLLNKNGQEWPGKYKDYIDKYGQFFLVGNSNEFAKLVKICKDQELEYFAVVLYDDIEFIDIVDSCFGSTQEHPFRGLFDGNGYALCIRSIILNKRASGIFGYIAENAIVKNFKILNAIVRDKALLIDDNVITVTVNESTNLISLNSIKRGAGDVNIGILAGVNNGIVENVVMSAKVVYDSVIRPDVYFVQNKTDQNGGKKQLISENILKAKLENNFTGTTALSSYENFCFPSPLCLNSEANLIPYVGYFNEGCFNSRVRDIDFSSTGQSEKLQPPLYKLYTSAGTQDKNDTTFNYMGDIWSLYDNKHTGDHYRHADKVLFGSTTNEDINSTDRLNVMSFRLGPNNKAAFLIGGLIGENNGDLTNISTVNTLTFNDNIVALIGGIAGRGSRGKITNVNARTSFFGSSGMYEEYLTVEDNTATENEYSASISLADITQQTYQGRLNLSNEQGVPLDVHDVNYNLNNMAVANAKVIAQLHMQPYGYLYINESTQPDVYEKYSCYTYNTLNIENPIKSNIVIPVIKYKVGSTSATFTVQNVTATVTDVSITDGYYRIGGSKVGIIDDIKPYSAATGNPPTVLTPVTSIDIAPAIPSMTVTYSSSQMEGMYGSFTVPVSALANPITLDPTQQANLAKQKFIKTSATMDIKLSPVYNIGGMFGEYIYSDGQSITDSTVFACVKDFKPNANNNELYHYKNVNKVASFACNCIFDSANKSNENAYKNSVAASANTVLQNNLKCSAIQVTANFNDVWHKNNTFNGMNCDDLTNMGGDKIQYIHYLQCYNMISPALIGTQYCDQAHAEGSNYPVNLGILYEDQIFYKYGLNMGSEVEYGVGNYDSISKVCKKISSLNGEGSGCYFHYPAQTSSHDITKQNNTSNKNMWSYNTILKAGYNIPNGVNTTAFVSKQLTAYPQHYGLYRGRASLHTNNHHFSATFDEADYLKYVYSAPQVTIDTSAKFFEAANNMITALDNMKPNMTPYYTYTYSSQEYLTTYITPIPLFVQYIDNVCNDPSCYTIEGLPEEISAAKYVMSSDSYKDFYIANSVTEQIASVNKLTATCVSGLQGEPRVEITTVSNPIFEVNEKSRNTVLGRITFKPIKQDFTNFRFEVGHTSRYATVAGQTVNENYKGYPVWIDDNGYIHCNGSIIKYDDVVNETYYADGSHIGVTVQPGIVRASFTVYYTDVNNIEHKEHFTIHISILHSEPNTDVKLYYTDDNTKNNNVVSSNALIYSYVPNSGVIVNLLNDTRRDSVVCTGLKADDIQYALIIDENKCPIMDIRLDANGAENEGYNIQFNRVGKVTKSSSNPPTYEFTYSGGSLINISGAK